MMMITTRELLEQIENTLKRQQLEADTMLRRNLSAYDAGYADSVNDIMMRIDQVIYAYEEASSTDLHLKGYER